MHQTSGLQSVVLEDNAYFPGFAANKSVIVFKAVLDDWIILT